MDSKNTTQKALAGLVSLALLSPTPSTAATPTGPQAGWVKCYGVAAAGKNDCGTPMGACPGTVAVAGACYAWIYTPKSICEKLNNASIDKPAVNCKITKTPT